MGLASAARDEARREFEAGLGPAPRPGGRQTAHAGLGRGGDASFEGHTVQDETQRMAQSVPSPPPTGVPPTGARPPEAPPATTEGAGTTRSSGGVPPRRPTAPAPPAAGDGQRPTPRNLETAPTQRTPPAPVEVPASYSSEPETLAPEPLYLPLTFTVGAGFKFGCGFMLSVALTGLLLFLIFSVMFFVASLAGIPLPFGPA